MTRNHTLPQDYYSTKKLIRDLGLSIEKIEACKNGCMLYWKDDIDLDYYKFCGEVRYKPTRERTPNGKKTLYAILRYLPVTPHLQMLYASEATGKQITWHANYKKEEAFMCHPFDAEVWRHFDGTYLNFSVEPHNVRLVLYIDGFVPHGQYNLTHLCWPFILTPYNLLLGTCINSEYMFLMMVNPGPSNPECLINVYWSS